MYSVVVLAAFVALSQGLDVQDFQEVVGNATFIFHQYERVLITIRGDNCYFTEVVTSLHPELADPKQRKLILDKVTQSIDANDFRASNISEARDRFHDRLADFHCFDKHIFVLELNAAMCDDDSSCAQQSRLFPIMCYDPYGYASCSHFCTFCAPPKPTILTTTTAFPSTPLSTTDVTIRSFSNCVDEIASCAQFKELFPMVCADPVGRSKCSKFCGLCAASTSESPTLTVRKVKNGEPSDKNDTEKPCTVRRSVASSNP
ncbi:uncharacterized protein LOC143290989 [Babylonia areolata]|uniref:uncharacterized protein LOC143290989 n=1 Tax=Babylonia areolata TaxID=304850 RepID=UPI003FD2C4EA